MSSPDSPSVDKTNWVVNVSSRSLSDAEGLNFTVTPEEHPCWRDYCQGRISHQTTWCWGYRHCQKSCQQYPSTGKTARAQHHKRNARHAWTPKRGWLHHGPPSRQRPCQRSHGCQQLPHKGVFHLTQKLSEKLLSFKWSEHLTEAFNNKIRPWHKQPPRFHGLLKIRKGDVPLRPIMWCVNTLTYYAWSCYGIFW